MEHTLNHGSKHPNKNNTARLYQFSLLLLENVSVKFRLALSFSKESKAQHTMDYANRE